MATYVNDLRLKEIATGDESGTWGTSTNTNLELIGEALGFGTEAITTNADTHTTTVADGSTDPGRAMYIKYTGTLDSTCTITIAPNTMSRMHFIENGTSGSQDIIISQGSGANVTIPNGDVKAVYLDGAGSGAAVTDAFASLSVVDLTVQGAFTSQGIDDNADATAITINSSEQVGIGVTPVVTLDVGGTSDLVASFRSSTNNGNTSEAKIRAVDSDSSHVAIFQYQGYQHRFQDASGNEKVRIDNSGNVAIGHTTTTGAKLAICDGANSQIQFFPEISTDTNLTQHYDPTASAYINAETRAASHVWKIGTSEYMRVHTDGNVGIGTSSPFNSARLSVTGGVNGTHAVFSGQASRGLKISTENTLNNDDGVAYDAQTSTGKHLFKVAGSEKMRIDGDGLKFNGDTAAANALDDYEEGTFQPTPSISGATGSISFKSAADTLSYTKIGDLVHIQGYLQIDTNTVNGGRLNLGNLPFTSVDSAEASGFSLFTCQLSSGSGSQASGFFTSIGEGLTLLQIQTYTGVGTSNDSAVTMVANSFLFIQGQYKVA